MAMTEAADQALYQPGNHPDLPPPASERGVIGWLKHNLFSSWLNAALTVIAVGLIVVSVPPILNWLIFDATWTVPPEVLAENRAPRFADCAKGAACWLFVDARLGQFFYGFYPAEERWRANVVFFILVGAGFLLLSPVLKDKRRVA